MLATTYGFPIELTQELAEERGQAVDIDRFRTLMEEHREVSRAGGESTTEQLAAEIVGAAHRPTRFVGYEKTDVLTAVIATGARVGSRRLLKLEESPFYAAGGGQVSDDGYLQVDGEDARYDVVEVLRFGDDQVLMVETGDADPFADGTRVHAVVTWSTRFPTMANHTATHLLHAALREVLGDHVKQAGSAVRPDKLRFDFSHTEALTAEEREQVERRVNEKVFEAIPVRTFVTPIEEARKLGAMMLFGEKYGDEVRVVEIDGFSRELCGGTHVRSTAEIGPFVILNESSVGSGARRIEAVTAGEAWAYLHGRARELDDVRAELEQARREAKKPKKAEAAGRRRARDRARGGDQRDRDGGAGRRRPGAARPLRPLQAAQRAGRDRARLARGRQREPRRQLRRDRRRQALGRRRGEGDRAARGRRRRRAADDGPRRRQGPRQPPDGSRPRARADRGRALLTMKVLALDYGSARTGVAVSDPTGTLARPLGVVHQVRESDGFERLIEVIGIEEPEEIVVGLPLTLRGEHGLQADETAEFVEALRGAVEMPVETYDERFTSVLADGDDARAAAHLLESYLEWRGNR